MFVNLTGRALVLPGESVESGGEGAKVGVPQEIPPNSHPINNPLDIPPMEPDKEYKVFIVTAEVGLSVPKDRVDVCWPSDGVERDGKIFCTALASHAKKSEQEEGSFRVNASPFVYY